jgi:hypothetical protein
MLGWLPGGFSLLIVNEKEKETTKELDTKARNLLSKFGKQMILRMEFP